MFLAFLTKEKSNLSINPIRDLTTAELAAFDSAISAFIAVQRYMFAPQMVYENDADFYSSIEKCKQDFRGHTYSLTGYVSTVNRVLTNYLSSMSFFLNFTTRKLGKVFGAASEEKTKFVKATNFAYDEVFAYRFMSLLRNYSQHCDQAVSGVSVTNSSDDLLKHSLVVFCHAETLLEDRKNWKNGCSGNRGARAD